MLALETAVGDADLDPNIVELVKLRCSRLNGCDYCIDLHRTKATQLGADEDTLNEVDNWAISDRFSPTESAALALADALTRLTTDDPSQAAASARAHFTDTHIAQLIYIIATINAWNRVATVHVH